ncbi:hypothetical protein ETAA8_35470 [Anatilimnocola aggregata]|uniref:3-keto-alpha-glucoside-1,2-lyase/3-keto-2-hydroxy-glucal hydratase domain-containing protein n=1 Tax=Anatilimnocola aggregata TaxID=2528021 RepID=A0A517YE14_9BACT|nr:DUF1080 domain-containing protein [Anatilimnocola aggregata]QDU28447.1 hypothetical protein ETAA8_35470 [Anatilimnocola aggregata]
MSRFASFAALLGGLLLQTLALAGPTYTDPDKTDADFAYQGEYAGTVKEEGNELTIGVQVIALGKGKFHAVGYPGGLPGDGWNKKDKVEADGEIKDGVLVFEQDGATAHIKDGTLTIKAADKELGKLSKVNRSSPTLGAKPPMGAVVLFDGKSADAFEGGKVSEDGNLSQGSTSKQKFGSYKLHVEFRTPYQPEDRGQARGNSGVYMQGRYEVQMLDSFGLAGKMNECGGLYSVKDCDLNMCFPPLAWQTYDIDYTAAKYDESGKVTAPAKITVELNGVVIHKDVELPTDRGTTAAPVKPGPEPGPIYLQNHGNPVRYRNIWLIEKK